MKIRRWFLFLLLLSPGWLHALAAPPVLINYQAELEKNGETVNTNGLPVVFELFDAKTLGTRHYAETQLVNVVDGRYATHLGSNGVQAALLNALQQPETWLQVTVDGSTLTPRERLVSVPFSLFTLNNDDADADPANEVNQSLVLNGSTLELTDTNGTLSVDLSGLTAAANSNDEKIVSIALVSNELVIVEGRAPMTNRVDLSSLLDGSEDPLNEKIMSMQLNGTDLIVVEGVPPMTNVVSLAALQGNQEEPGTVEVLGGVEFECGFGEHTFVVQFTPAFSAPPAITLTAEVESQQDGPMSEPLVIDKSATAFTGSVDLAHGVVTLDSADPNSLLMHNASAHIGGRPAVCYVEQVTAAPNVTFKLFYVRAGSAEGKVWDIPVEVLSRISTNAGDGFSHLSMLEVNGRPAMAFYDGQVQGLRYIRSDNAAGTSWTAPPLTLDTDKVGMHNSLAIVNGNPAISYHDWNLDRLNLKYVRAQDAGGTAWNAPVVVTSAGRVGAFTCLAVTAGRPAISFYQGDTGDLMFVWAADGNGLNWGTPVVADAVGNVGLYGCMKIVNGLPAISYIESAGHAVYRLKYVRALTVNGNSWETGQFLDAEAVLGPSRLMVVKDSPAIAYSSPGGIKYIRARDQVGASWSPPELLNQLPGGTPYGVLVGARPGISYRYTGGGPQEVRFIYANAMNINWIAVSADPGPQ